MAEGSPWRKTEAQGRKSGEETGIDTLVGNAVNDVELEVVQLIGVASEDNALSRPTGEYDRKVKTQMN